MNRKKILFIQVGKGFWYPNQHLIRELALHFPNHTIELFDVMPLAKKGYGRLLLNAGYVLTEFFLDFVTFRKNILNFKQHFTSTVYFFDYLSELVRQKISSHPYSFIIQTQCLCSSANKERIPFFIYTDHTNLNNWNYRFAKATEFALPPSFTKREKATYLAAERIFVMSQNIQQSLIEQYKIKADRITLVYVSTNTAVLASPQPEKYASRNIVFVGKDWERKGGPLLVKAFVQVRKILPDATLTILGCTPGTKQDGIEELGEVSLDEVAKAYQRAAVFCLPTKREPFGIVFLEAMFYRLPVITNRTGATPHIFEHEVTGYLLNNDAKEYAQCLISLLSNPALGAEVGNKAYQVAQEFYTWQNVGNLMAGAIKAELRIE